jgi:uncharacterized protein YbcC (UPF0753/DUF2309 family)
MTDTSTPTSHARLLVELDEAARVIGPMWPLGTFIAVNPFWDLRQLGFAGAVSVARMVFGAHSLPSSDYFADALWSGRVTSAEVEAAIRDQAAETRGSSASPVHLAGWSSSPSASAVEVNRQVAKWCAAFLSSQLPGAPEVGFYPSWHAVVRFDPGTRALLGRKGRASLAELPERAEDALAWCLDELGLDRDGWRREFVAQLAALPGWAAHAKWRSRWAPAGTPGPGLDLVDLVAVRLAYDTMWRRARPTGSAPPARGARTRPSAVHDPRSVPGLSHSAQAALAALDRDQASSAWLLALEHHYRDELLGLLGPTTGGTNPDPDAQIISCIDARSEGVRRHLEAAGAYETFGFAGFFALPLRYTALGAEPVDLLPVLLSPTVDMAERAAGGREAMARRRLAGEQVQAQSGHAFAYAREHSVAPFMLAEAGGFVAAPLLAARTLSPARFARVRGRLSSVMAPPAPTEIDADPGRTGMPDEEQALFAETALITMGLTRDFAPLVVLCGHGSTTENNPHAASLDCGACGGNRGAASARAACAILNRQPVRSLLAGRGIVIPDKTHFVAAEHDTATDIFLFYDLHLVPEEHRESVTRLRDDLARAGAALAAERLADLDPSDDGDPVEAVHHRSADWAELQPEWGLARNASFIVGPRGMTEGIDLRRRSFLHSYDPDVDPDGTALETILTAPMVVAHWINMQYYFSTVDPEVFAAGDKTVHNIVAGIGVTEGAGGDLKVGLPLQSLFVGERAFHEPLRLLTVVEAPIARIDEVIARNPVLRELFGGQWVHLAARDTRSAPWKLRRLDGTWAPWGPPAHAGSTAPHPIDKPEPEQEARHG